MPTPYGSRGALAFSADELRVLRRALASALLPDPEPAPPGPDRVEEVQELFRLAQAVDEAVLEGGRLRAFLLAELARYREALPGAAVGYLERLQEALAAGHAPCADDLSALRALCAAPVGPAEAARRAELLRECEALVERGVWAPGGGTAVRPGRWLLALPGGRAGGSPEGEPPSGADPDPQPEPQPQPQPEPEPEPERGPPGGRPGRPVPTPAEVFPPRRDRPAPPPSSPEEWAVV